MANPPRRTAWRRWQHRAPVGIRGGAGPDDRGRCHPVFRFENPRIARSAVIDGVEFTDLLQRVRRLSVDQPDVSVSDAPFRQPGNIRLQPGQPFGVVGAGAEVFSSSCRNLAPVVGLLAGCIKIAGGGSRGTLRSSQTGLVVEQEASKLASRSAGTLQRSIGFTFQPLILLGLLDQIGLDSLASGDRGIQFSYHYRQPQAVLAPAGDLVPRHEAGRQQRRSCKAVDR